MVNERLIDIAEFGAVVTVEFGDVDVVELSKSGIVVVKFDVIEVDMTIVDVVEVEVDDDETEVVVTTVVVEVVVDKLEVLNVGFVKSPGSVKSDVEDSELDEVDVVV